MRMHRLGAVVLGAAVLGLVATSAASHVQGAAKAIKIGVLTDCTGFWSFEHDDTLGSADLALIQHGATAAGASPETESLARPSSGVRSSSRSAAATDRRRPRSRRRGGLSSVSASAS